MRVSVHIVTHGSLPDIEEGLASLERQTFEDFRVVVVDNASSDRTVSLLEQKYGDRIALLRNYQNLGFSAAHNQAIRLFARDGVSFVLVMNPDIVLEPSTLAELVACAQRHNRAGAIAPRLVRPTGTVLDSTGIRARRSFHFFERGSGKPSEGNYLREEEVFGASGALALYRHAALEDVAVSGEIFDEDFFAYKEDIDLSWRLRLKGWEVWYAPRAVAVHRRAVGAPAERGFRAQRYQRAKRSPAIAQWSYRNHWWTLLKNLHWTLALRNLPWLFAHELAKGACLLLFEFRTLRVGCVQMCSGLPRILRKRRAIMATATVSARDLRRWFG